jgi:cytidylate kinase
MRVRPLVIAVAGPAASGKGTIARALAAHYGLPHLDTGLLYRAVGLGVARSGFDVADAAAAARVAGALPDPLPDDPDLRSERASELASIASAHARVRDLLLARQRAFAARPGGAVIDGRDIGTVIAPDATVKLFVTASPEVRAGRRWRETGGDYARVLTAIRERDARDAGRAAAPLRQAEDAALLDTSDLGIEEAVRRALSLVAARIARG